jgi:hypothetical protein
MCRDPLPRERHAPDAIPGVQAVVLRILRRLASKFSFAGNLPQPLPRGPQGLPMRIHSHRCVKVQSLASAAVILVMRYDTGEVQVSVSDQVLLACVLDGDHGSSAQQARDIFQ